MICEREAYAAVKSEDSAQTESKSAKHSEEYGEGKGGGGLAVMREGEDRLGASNKLILEVERAEVVVRKKCLKRVSGYSKEA